MQIPNNFKLSFKLGDIQVDSLEEFYALDKRSVLEHFGFIISKDQEGYRSSF